MNRWIPIFALLAACGGSATPAPTPDAAPSPEHAAATDAPAAVAEDWTCPMHPEVHQDHPGDCPECGMHLEKK